RAGRPPGPRAPPRGGPAPPPPPPPRRPPAGPPPAAAAAPVLPGVPAVLTAVRVPQARVLNPSPPTGVAAAAGNAQVTLSWRPPASNGGAAIIGYDVYMGTSPGGEGRGSVSGMIGGTAFTGARSTHSTH